MKKQKHECLTHGYLTNVSVFVASSAYLVCVAGVGAGQRLGAGRGRSMSMGLGVHVEEGGGTGVYTHLSARYGVHCKTTGQWDTSLVEEAQMSDYR